MSDASASRRQLTLLVSGAEVRHLNALREVLDPVQFSLIPAHVTLCREDETYALGPQQARDHEPHLTLAHPRDPRAPGNTDEAIRACPASLTIHLASVAPIEQQQSMPWQTRWEAGLGDVAPSVV